MVALKLALNILEEKTLYKNGLVYPLTQSQKAQTSTKGIFPEISY